MNLKAFFLILIIFLSISILTISAENNPKIVALTFNDGPRPAFLSKILPYLEQEGIKATFFVIGQSGKNVPQWLTKESVAGHLVENHSFYHSCFGFVKKYHCGPLPLSAAIWEINETSKIIENATGKQPRFFRPPYLAMNREIKARLEAATNIKVLLFDSGISIDSCDSHPLIYKNPAKIIQITITEIKKRNGGPLMILFHENPATILALPAVVEFLKKQGYEFVTLEDFEKRCPERRIY